MGILSALGSVVGGSAISAFLGFKGQREAAVWHCQAIVFDVPVGASDLQVRLNAAVDTTDGLILYATGITIERY